jgi:hypothetical protein
VSPQEQQTVGMDPRPSGCLTIASSSYQSFSRSTCVVLTWTAIRRERSHGPTMLVMRWFGSSMMRHVKTGADQVG